MKRALLAMCAVLAAGQRIMPLSDIKQYYAGAEVSPDGKLIAFGDEDWLAVRPIDGGPAIHFAQTGPDITQTPENPSWSPDGHQLAFQLGSCHHCPNTLVVKPYPKGPQRFLGESCRAPAAWTPDGQFLIVSAPNGGDPDDCHLVRIRVDRGLRSRIAPDGDVVAISPDGKRFAYGARNVVKLASLTAEARIDGSPVIIAREPHEIGAVHWTTDGQSILYTSRGLPRLVSASGKHEIRVIDPGAHVSILQLLPDHSALGEERLEKRELWRQRRDSGQPEKVRDIPWTDRQLAVSPDGKSVAFYTERTRPPQILESRIDGTQPTVLVPAIPPMDRYGDRTGIASIAWSPDGNSIAFTTFSGQGHGDERANLYVVPSRGGNWKKLFEGSQWELAWSADGSSIFMPKYDDHYNATYYQIALADGKATEVPKDRIPKSAREEAGLTIGDSAHFANGYIYFEKHSDWKSRLVRIANFP
jgi:Tol biopolymer transport system component